MKYLLLSITFLLTIHAATAAPEKIKSIKDLKKYIKKVQSDNNRANAKTTAAYWRLQSFSIYADQGSGLEIIDSGIYKYSNARGSSYDYEENEYYDYGVDPDYNTVLADTVLRYGDQGAGFELNERYTSTYDANNRRTVFVDEQGTSPNFTNSEKEEGAYDNNGNLVKETYYGWQLNSWNKYITYFYTYDGNNRLQLDSGFNYSSNNPSYKATFTYDASGNMIESTVYDWIANSWTPSYKASLQYDVNNREVASIYQRYDNGSWINVTKDSSAYTGNADLCTYYLYQDWDTANKEWINSVQQTRSLNTQGKPTIATYRTWDTSLKKWGNPVEANYTYTQNGDPDVLTAYQYVNGTKPNTPTAIARYYYEYYFNVGINSIVEKESIKIYPNPATNKVRINIVNSNIKKITLLNMAGQTQIAINVANKRPYYELDVSNYISGIYFLQIETTEGRIISKKLLIK